MRHAISAGDRRFLQAAFGEVNWVLNLRAAGQAVVTKGRHHYNVDAVELAPETAGAIMPVGPAPTPVRRQGVRSNSMKG